MADLNKMLQEANEADANKDYATAVRIYSELVGLVPVAVKGKLQLYKAVSLFNKGDYEVAVNAFNEAISSKDEQVLANAYAGLARALDRCNKFSEALDAFEECSKVDSTNQFMSWAEYAHCANQAKEYERALDVASRGLDKKPEDYEKFHNERIFAFFKLDKPMESLDDIEAVLKKKQMGELRPEQILLYTEILLQKGHELMQKEEFTGALSYFQRVNDATKSGQSSLLIGLCYLRMRKDKEAKTWLLKAVEAEPNKWKHHIGLGVVSMRPDTENFELAHQSFMKAMQLDEAAKTANNHFNNGFALMKLRRDNEAKPSLEFVYSHDESNWQAAALLGTIVLNEQNYERAVEVLERAIAKSNDQADDSIYYNLAYAYMMLNRYKEAAENFKKAINLNPSNKPAKVAFDRMMEEVKQEEERTRKEVEERQKAEQERIQKEKQAEEMRKLAVESERQAKAQRDADKKKEAERKAKEEKLAADKAQKEAEEQKKAEELQIKIKKQEARERKLKRLAELKVLIGEPQRLRARRASLEIIPVGNTGKNANAYVDWYNDKIVHTEKK